MNKTWTDITELLGGRKFIVFLVATGLVIGKVIDQTTWLWVVGMYVGGNIAEIVANKLNLKVG